MSRQPSTGRRHDARGRDGKFAAARPKHVQSAYPAAAVRPADFRPHKAGQVTRTAGVNPDPPASRQATADWATTIPYAGGSPTGFDPATLGTI